MRSRDGRQRRRGFSPAAEDTLTGHGDMERTILRPPGGVAPSPARLNTTDVITSLTASVSFTPLNAVPCGRSGHNGDYVSGAAAQMKWRIIGTLRLKPLIEKADQMIQSLGRVGSVGLNVGDFHHQTA